MASRACRRVQEQKPSVEVSDVARKALLDRLVQAIMTHDKSALLDGGGKAKAALRIIRGRERVPYSTRISFPANCRLNGSARHLLRRR